MTPEQIDRVHAILGDLSTCSQLLRMAWLGDSEDAIGYLSERLVEHTEALKEATDYNSR